MQRQLAVERYQGMISEWKEDAVRQQEQRTRMQTMIAEEQEFAGLLSMMRQTELEEVPQLEKAEERIVHPASYIGKPPAFQKSVPVSEKEEEEEKGKDDGKDK